MKRLLVFLLAAFILSACASKENAEDSKKAPEKETTNETLNTETEEHQEEEEDVKTAPEEEQANPEAEEKATPAKDETQDTKEPESVNQVDPNQPLTQAQAEELVRKHLNIQGNPNVQVKYDHDAANGDYIIQVYEVVVDDQKTGQGHTNTWGWFGVNKTTKEVYDSMN